MNKKLFSILLSASILASSVPVLINAENVEIDYSNYTAGEEIESTSAAAPIYFQGYYVGTTKSSREVLTANMLGVAEKVWNSLPKWVRDQLVNKAIEKVIEFIKLVFHEYGKVIVSYSSPSGPPTVRAVLGRNGEIITINNCNNILEQ